MNKHPANGGDWSAPFGNWAAAGSNAQVSFGINGRTTASYDLYFGIDGGTYQNVVPGGDWNATRWCHYRYQYVHSTRAFTAWVNGDVKAPLLSTHQESSTDHLSILLILDIKVTITMQSVQSLDL